MALSERVPRLKSSLIRETLTTAQRPEVMSLAGGLPVKLMLPKAQWGQMPASMGQYGISEGEPALRETIIVEACALGVPCEASQALIVSGLQQTLDLASKLLIDPGTEVLLEVSIYLAALQAFQLFGVDCVTVPLGAKDPDLVALRQRLEQHEPAPVCLIPILQNPSGVRYNEERRDAMTALLGEFGVTLVEDELYRELVFDQGRVIPLIGRLHKSSWIYTDTMSKTLLPGLCVDSLIATPDLFPHLSRSKRSTDLHTNRVEQRQALQRFGSEAYCQHPVELHEFYRARHDAMQEVLLEHFGGLVEWNTLEGRLFFWLTPGQSPNICTLLQPTLVADVAFMPGGPFFTEPEQNLGRLRLSLSHVVPEHLHEGLRRLTKVIHDAQAAEAA